MSELSKLITTVEEHTVYDQNWGWVAKALLKWLYYYIARCDLWKRAAAKWRDAYHSIDTSAATRRKELLRRCAKVIVTVENLYPDGFEFEETNKLLDELAEELGDAVGGEG